MKKEERKIFQIFKFLKPNFLKRLAKNKSSSGIEVQGGVANGICGGPQTPPLKWNGRMQSEGQRGKCRASHLPCWWGPGGTPNSLEAHHGAGCDWSTMPMVDCIT